MIKPSIGRVVWYQPGDGSGARDGFVQHGGAFGASRQPCAAIITYVWSDTMVNLVVFDHNGVTHQRTSVDLRNDAPSLPTATQYCEWMPYQKGQAAKTEALESKLAEKSP